MKNKLATIIDISIEKKPKNYGSGIEVGFEKYPKEDLLKQAVQNYIAKKKING